MFEEQNPNNERTNEENDTDTDYMIDEITADIEKINYGIYQKIRAWIFYFNNAKESTKRLVDRWTLISIAAFIFLAMKRDPGLPIDRWLTISIIEFAISICIFALWFKDCYIIHRNIRVLYEVAVELELKHERFGKPFSNMAKLLHSKFLDPNIINGFYYVIQIAISSILAVFSFYQWSGGDRKSVV